MSNLLDKVANFIIHKHKAIEKFFFIFVVLNLIFWPFVGVNYDLSSYLPSNAVTKQGLDLMEQEFGYPGTARIMIKDVSIYEAKHMKDRINALDGVDMVMWADTTSDIYQAQSYLQNSDLEDYYKDGCAVMDVTFTSGDSDPETRDTLDQIYEIIGDKGHYSGSAVSNKFRQESITKEIAIAMVISIVIIFLILTLATTSWFEPVLFISIMLIAIVLNMGSNLIFGTISFFTFSTAAILQLAVSMDYSIFLLHTFTAYKESGMPIEQALAQAVKDASKSILASGATTIVGFLSIALMEFTIGRDVGFVLTKGIIISLLCVLVLMPALILRFYDKIEKYRHRAFIPPFNKVAKGIYKIRYGVLIFALLMAVPSYVGQDMNHFLYGDDAIGSSEGTLYYEDTQLINEKFGESNLLLAIIPNTSSIKEKLLTEELEEMSFVNYATSLSGTLPQGVPESFLPNSLTKQLRTKNYARILISMKTDQESDYAFQCSNAVDQAISKYYPENSYSVGMTPTTIDIKNILREDYSRVSIISMLGVALVVLFTFHSALTPLIVILPIEVAIYLNMTIPYLLGDDMLFIGYIIVSCLQLGATIDYSILLTNHYMDARMQMNPQDAAITAISKSFLSILTSGSILTVVGYLLYFTSTIQAISQVGRLVGRGTLLSMLLVLTVLPGLLSALDKVIMKEQSKFEALREKLRPKKGRDLSKLSLAKKETCSDVDSLTWTENSPSPVTDSITEEYTKEENNHETEK